jgi:hypothetical protein
MSDLEAVARELQARLSPSAPPSEGPVAGLPGDPWERRLLVALADHVVRQRWVAEVVEKHLSGSTRTLGAEGAFGHPAGVPQRGRVPTLRGWSYFFHGIGCCLTHEGGTVIDVDFDERGAEGIDPSFYAKYLQSVAPPFPVEALLPRASTSNGWMADLDGLANLGWIAGQYRVHLTEDGARWAAVLGPVLREMVVSPSAPRRLAIALAVGDDAFAARDADGAALGAIQERRVQAVEGRVARLGERLRATRNPSCLFAIADLEPKAVEPWIAEILAGDPVDGLVSAALHFVEAGDPRFTGPLLALALRATGSAPPAPYLRSRALRTVMAGYRSDTLPAEVRAQLVAILGPDAHSSEALAALLLTLLAPEEGVSRLGRALHHRVPCTRYEAAAALVFLGTAEAAAVLRTSDAEEAKPALALLRGFAPEPAA